MAHHWLFVTTLAICGASVARSASAQDHPSVVVVIHDSASVPADVLDSARGFVAAVFDRAGVSVRWDVNGGAGTACRAGRNRSVDDRFCVQVLLRPRNPVSQPGKSRVMGLALAADERRAVLSIYFDAVTDVSRQYGASLGDVLGIAFAHEMGHVMLPPPSHAASGIMQPSWEGDDLRHLLGSRPSFTTAQITAMRDLLARRKAGAAP
jgi:hypothetical protein